MTGDAGRGSVGSHEHAGDARWAAMDYCAVAGDAERDIAASYRRKAGEVQVCLCG